MRSAPEDGVPLKLGRVAYVQLDLVPSTIASVFRLLRKPDLRVMLQERAQIVSQSIGGVVM